MMYEEVSIESRTRRTLSGAARVLLELRIDGPLVVGLSLIAAYGLVVLYSASGQSLPTVLRTVVRLVVAAIGHIGMGAQRWLDLGVFRFQPSELMKLAVPMMCAWYLHERPLPPGSLSLAALAALILDRK